MFPSGEESEVLDKNKESLTVSSGLPSVFGAWHFLTIFLFIGVAVIAGYLCLHNRQKVRASSKVIVSVLECRCTFVCQNFCSLKVP